VRVTFIDERCGTVEVGGQRTRLYDAGDGPPVVVLHGWGGRIESVGPILRCLDGSFRVLALDLPGFGEAPAPRGVWGTPDYAIFVRDVLAEASVDKAFFVGHSFGAKTVLYLAATHPGIADKIVLTGAAGLRTAPSLAARAKRLLSSAARTAGLLGPPGKRIRDAVYDRIASQDYRDAGPLRPILVRAVHEDLTELLPRVSVPTLLIWGSADDAAPLSHGETMERLIPDAGLVVFEGAGHFAYLDEAGRFCTILRHFFGAE
jgi:pimeloyl-ACP methyl ester carboxylesterase